MNYSESMSKRQQRRKALNQRFRRMFLVALLMGLAMGFIFGRCSAVNSKAPDAPIEPDQLKATGTAQKTVGLATLRELLIPVAPYKEQMQIYAQTQDALSIVDSVIQCPPLCGSIR